MDKTAEIAAGLSDFEREWLIGWQGSGGAAFNCTAMDLLHKGLLCGSTNWNLNEKGRAVRAAILQEQSNAD